MILSVSDLHITHLQICTGLDYIDPVWETLCLGLIHDLLPEIIMELVEYFLTPSEVCVKIGWCQNPSTTTNNMN